MLYASKNSRSKLMHTKKCRYRFRIARHNLIRFYNLSDGLKEGFYLCSCFCCDDESITTHNSSIGEKLIANDIDVMFNGENGFDIVTPYSEWKVVSGKNKRKSLYHKNECDSPNTVSKINGFHYQSIRVINLEQVIDYIIEHDKYRKSKNVDLAKLLAGKNDVSIDPNLKKVLRKPIEKSKRTKNLESYQNANYNKVHNSNKQGKKARSKKKSKKRIANSVANQENLVNVYKIIEELNNS